jgi:hypothetical protein
MHAHEVLTSEEGASDTTRHKLAQRCDICQSHAELQKGVCAGCSRWLAAQAQELRPTTSTP